MITGCRNDIMDAVRWSDMKKTKAGETMQQMKDRPRRPAADCDQYCERCGWNPGVAKKRFQRMKPAESG